jgi:flagellar biosynthesis/type III secretory pathway chaperone
MENMLAALKSNLKAEIEYLQILIELALQKREFIIEKESEKLSQNILEADQIVKKVYQLVEERKKVYKTLEFEGKLHELVREKVPDDKREEWLNLLDERKEITTQLQREESLNKKLIEDQLELVKFMLDLLQPVEKKRVNTYTRNGSIKTLGNVVEVNFQT